MWEQQTGSILLVEGDQLLGILTERDVLKAVAEGTDLDAPVAEVMSKELVTVDPSTTLRDAARDHGRPVDPPPARARRRTPGRRRLAARPGRRAGRAP